MSRIVTYETESDADMTAAAAAVGEEEVPLLVLGGPARRSLGHLAGSAQRRTRRVRCRFAPADDGDSAQMCYLCRRLLGQVFAMRRPCVS